MLNHHSRNLLIHLSVLALLIGEYLVNISKNINRKTYLLGMKARVKAATTRATANFSLAWSPLHKNPTKYEHFTKRSNVAIEFTTSIHHDTNQSRCVYSKYISHSRKVEEPSKAKKREEPEEKGTVARRVSWEEQHSHPGWSLQLGKLHSEQPKAVPLYSLPEVLTP